MANLSIGSSGEEVKKLQNALINAGYDVGSTGADGKFGSATLAAVKKYQGDNGLSVDGIAGTQTQSSLYGGGNGTAAHTASYSSTPQQSAYKPTAGAAPTFDINNDSYYQQAMAALEAAKQNAPTYAGTYDAQLKDLYDQIVGRDKFKYDINGDELYQQYAKQYAEKGRMAMADTMGQAAALTGGYGSTYSQAVGQQAYDAYLQQLNEIIPQLEQRAYQRYQDEGNQMAQQYAMLGDLREREYDTYQDDYNRWLNERSYAQGNADNAFDRAYSQYVTELNQFNANRDYDRAMEQFYYQQQRDAMADQQWAQEFALQQQKASGSVSGSSGTSTSKSSGGGGYNNAGVSEAQVKVLQSSLNNSLPAGQKIAVDGKWGAESTAASGYDNAADALRAYIANNPDVYI